MTSKVLTTGIIKQVKSAGTVVPRAGMLPLKAPPGYELPMRYRTATRNDFRVRKTRSGLGLFTTRSFSRGDFVIEYTGAILANEMADRRGGRYLFRVNSKWTIDGVGRGNLSRYINHSCEPNCVAYTRGLKIRIYARRAITPGEELSYDYGKEYFDAYILPKGCGCSRCARGESA